MISQIAKHGIALRLLTLPVVVLSTLIGVAVYASSTMSGLLEQSAATSQRQLELREELAILDVALERARGLVVRAPAEFDLELQAAFKTEFDANLGAVQAELERLATEESATIKEIAVPISVIVADVAAAGDQVFELAANFAQDEANAVVAGAFDAADVSLSEGFVSLREAFDAEAATAQQRLETDQADAKSALFISASLAALFMLIYCLLTTRSVLSPLSQITNAMNHVAEGDLDAEPPYVGRRDEIGAMASALAVFRHNAIDKVAAERAEAELREARDRETAATAEKDELMRASIDRIVAAVVDGNLSARIEERFGDEKRDTVIERVNELLRIVDDSLKQTRTAVRGLAQGDLSQRVDGDFCGAFAELQSDLNSSFEKLSLLVGEFKDTSLSMSDGAKNIATGANDLSQRAEQQATSLEETTATMEEMTTAIKQTAKNADLAREFSDNAASRAARGGEVVGETVNAMKRIEESSSKISEIISVIDAIAFQTNLLALNAAVEAARAGDAGKGFAIVAAEVRTLAQRSTDAAKDISRLITESSSHVSDGVALVRRTGDSLTEIVQAVSKLAETISDVNLATREQASGADEINQSVSFMEEMTQQNATLAEQSASSAKGMNQQAERLVDLVSFFSNDGAGLTGTASNTAESGTDQEWQSVENLSREPAAAGPVENPSGERVRLAM